MPSEWRPIETAPKDGTLVLTWDGERRYVAMYDCGWYIGIERGPNIEPTHWMPLPEPPQPASSFPSVIDWVKETIPNNG